MKRYKEIEKSKDIYLKDILKESFENKLQVLIRLQKKALFFGKIKYTFSESFQMNKVIKILDKLKKENLIKDYVIGGATALLYYTTPSYITEDIDIFIHLESKGLILDLSNIYQYLKKNYKAKEKGEYILIDNNPIQFLVPGDKITKEAFNNANNINIGIEKFKIFSLEYLIAIMLYLNKIKYKERLRVVKEEKQYDENKLIKILKEYDLLDKWIKIK
jgi:hypothetical protein